MNFACYINYFNESMAKTSIGSKISLGIFGMVALFVVLGAFYGFIRGFSKTVIRILTIGLSAGIALYITLTASNVIIDAIMNAGANNSHDLLEVYSPGIMESMPPLVGDILYETDTRTAAIVVSMIASVFILPILFITAFYILKTLTFIVYKLLSGLAGAVSIGNGLVNSILGAVAGVVQGILIAGIILFPIGGICSVAVEARSTLVEADSSGQIEYAYTEFIDDLADNPIFATVNTFGGEAAYGELTTVVIGEEEIDMSVECKSFFKLVAEAMPFTDPSFDWANPTDMEKDTFNSVVENVGDNHLVASLISDVMRGIARSVRTGNLELPFDGVNLELMESVMEVFATSTADNVEQDLHTVVDVYIVMCDRNLLSAFNEGDKHVLRDMLTETNEDGEIIMQEIINKLNENERMVPVVTAFTSITVKIMHEELHLSGESEQVYNNLKDPLKDVLNLTIDQFDGSEEEYKENVKSSLDKTLSDNGIKLNDDVQNEMVDYITENYGSSNEEVTDADINNALLSYFTAYANTKENSGDTPPAETDTYTVTVVDQNGDAVVGAEVYISNSDGTILQSATTDADGKASVDVETGTVMTSIRIASVPDGYTVPADLGVFAHGTFEADSFEATITITKD